MFVLPYCRANNERYMYIYMGMSQGKPVQSRDYVKCEGRSMYLTYIPTIVVNFIFIRIILCFFPSSIYLCDIYIHIYWRIYIFVDYKALLIIIGDGR